MSAAEPQRPPERDPFAVSDQEIDAVLEEAAGDAREAIRILRDLVVIAADTDAAASRGFQPGACSEFPLRAGELPSAAPNVLARHQT